MDSVKIIDSADPAIASDVAVASAAGRNINAISERTGQMMDLVRIALNDDRISETKLEALLRMSRDIESDDARRQFNKALHDAQREMPRVKKNGTIDLGEDKQTGKKRGEIPFATWEDVDAAVRPIMQRHGFSVTFSCEGKTEHGILWTATHRHVAGHSEQNSIVVPLDTGPGRSPIQAAGSTQSYAKRYLVEAFYNIVRESQDDDGRASGERYITEEQAEELRVLLNETKTEMGRWLQMVPGTRSLEEIPAAALHASRNSLLAKKAAMAAKAARS
jgi:hypothetical protein